MEGDYKKAQAYFSKVVSMDPKNVEAWHFLGGSKHHLGDYTGAIADYTRAIDLSPAAYHSVFNRGLSRHHRKELGTAIIDYSKTITMNRDFARAWAKGYQGDVVRPPPIKICLDFAVEAKTSMGRK